MIDLPQQPAAIIKKAGKRTAILQIVSIGLLCVLTFLYVDVSSRQTRLYDGVHENAIWAVYQLDREVRNVSKLTALALERPQLENAAVEEILLRFDILMSRVDLLHKPGFEAFFRDLTEISEKEKLLTSELALIEPMFDNIEPAGDHFASLPVIGARLKVLEKVSNDLLLTANSVSTVTRAAKRESVYSLQQLIAVFVAMLLASIAILIVTLQRQLNSVRTAGITLEEMARRLADAYHAADAGNRAKSQFMATMGHEIRTPLNAILGTAELLELSRIDPEVKTSVRTIRSSGEALLEVLNEILDYSKIEHGKLELELQAVNIENLVDTVSSIMSGRAKEHGNRIVLDVPETLAWPWVYSDPTRIRQILLNLMSNAIKFTNDGTVTLRLAERSGPNATKILRFEVSDTGIGIDEEGQKKLFQPFSQVDASISRRFGGTGLGLTICKEIATRLGGHMGVESVVGEGSTFWLEIPVEQAAEPSEDNRTEQFKNLERLPELKILLAEDNKVNQQIITRFLERFGQTATIANNGEEAVQCALENSYDVILMDMQMPVKDGITAAREIRLSKTRNSRTPIFALTANASDDDRRECMKAGMNGFELKPVTISRLHGMLLQAAPQGSVFPVKASVETMAGTPVEMAPAVNKFSPVSGLDPDRKAELCDALGEDIFAELLDSFFNDAVFLLQELQEASRKEDIEGIDQALHTIKGAAANVGFKVVAEMAQSLREEPELKNSINDLEKLINEEKQALAA